MYTLTWDHLNEEKNPALHVRQAVGRINLYEMWNNADGSVNLVVYRGDPDLSQNILLDTRLTADGYDTALTMGARIAEAVERDENVYPLSA